MIQEVMEDKSAAMLTDFDRKGHNRVAYEMFSCGGKQTEREAFKGSTGNDFYQDPDLEQLLI